MTRNEYIRHLAAIYLEANKSDIPADEGRPSWLQGHECSYHCRAIDIIVSDMDLGPNWLETNDSDYDEDGSR